MRTLAPFFLLVCCSVPAFPDTWIYTFTDRIGFPAFNIGFSFETHGKPLDLTRTEYGPQGILFLSADQMTSSFTGPGNTVQNAEMWWESEPGTFQVPPDPLVSYPGSFRVDFNYGGSWQDSTDFTMFNLSDNGSYEYHITDQAGFTVQDVPDVPEEDVQSVPEPSSWVLAGLGLLLMAGFVRWIRRQASAETAASLKTLVTRA